MIWAAPAAAFLVALVTAAVSGPVLRRLPEPTDDPDAADKLPYVRLARPRFITGVGVLSLVSSLLAFGRVPPEHWLSWVALSGPGALAVAIDAATTWIPRYVTRAMGVTAAAGIGVCWTWTGNAQVPLRGLAGFVLMGGFFWLTWRITGGIGYADVRLMGVVGAVTAVEMTL